MFSQEVHFKGFARIQGLQFAKIPAVFQKYLSKKIAAHSLVSWKPKLIKAIKNPSNHHQVIESHIA